MVPFTERKKKKKKKNQKKQNGLLCSVIMYRAFSVKLSFSFLFSYKNYKSQEMKPSLVPLVSSCVAVPSDTIPLCAEGVLLLLQFPH